MKRARRRQEGKGGLALVEEATHLLRTAPAATLAAYYLGTVPFGLGLLYFWADMSRSPFANRHLVEAALAMSAIFFWMKLCQAVFAFRMRAHIANAPVPRWTTRQYLRVAVVQSILQPLGLVPVGLWLLAGFAFAPLAVLLAPVIMWVLSFFQNVTALADRDSVEIKPVFRKAWQQWWLWRRQNVIVLALMLAFGFYIFINWAIGCFMLPQLIKMLFGIESDFTKSPGSLLNTTFFMAIFVLTWLCVDPILKVVYTLRCFYGESLASGHDLRAGLKQVAPAVQSLAAAMALFVVLAGAPSANGAEAPPPSVLPAKPQVSPPGVSPPELDRAINDTVHQRKYTWRMPREKIVEADSEKGFITRFVLKVTGMIRKWLKAAMNWLSDLLDKLFRRRQPPGSRDPSGYGWIMSLQILFYVLIAAAIVALAFLLYRIWRGSMPAAAAVASEPLQTAPDLTDENVGADQLPEDGWTRLARELLERGEFRLAMRAFYLASLAHLAQRNLISLARFKSNRDYSLELRRRGHSFPELLSVFGDNISVFERIWYGMHEVNRDLVDRFAANVERIRVGG